MTLRRAARLCVFEVLAVTAAGSSFAAERACLPMTIEADAKVRDRWPDLPELVREALGPRVDIDACARIELTMNGSSIRLKVVLADGRSALRSVFRREDVLPMLEALLLVPNPPSSPPAPAAPAEPSVTTPAPLTIRLAARRESQLAPVDSVPPTGVSSSAFGVELSIAAIARFGDGQTGISLGVLSFLDIDGWLAGFEGRLDQYRTNGGGRGATALDIAFLGGRRLRLHSASLDLVVGPAVAMTGMSEITRQAPASGSASAPATISNQGPAPRMLLGARLNWSAHSVVRTFIGIEGEWALAGAPVPGPHAHAAPLPLWTGGVALGATVGTL